MKTENGKLILERRPCVYCQGTKLVPGRMACGTCHGTGKGTRGKARGCRGGCSGYGTVGDFINKVPCTRDDCDPNGTIPETLYDYAPDSIWQAFRFVVYRENRELTWGESYLALNNVFSCTDYGSAFAATDDSEVIEYARKNRGHQACKFFKEDGTMADHIAICATKSGYTVTAVYAKQATIVEPKELVA